MYAIETDAAILASLKKKFNKQFVKSENIKFI
jgi:hypothetical protein